MCTFGKEDTVAITQAKFCEDKALDFTTLLYVLAGHNYLIPCLLFVIGFLY